MKKLILFTLTAMMLAGCSFEMNEVDEDQDSPISFEIIKGDEEE